MRPDHSLVLQLHRNENGIQQTQLDYCFVCIRSCCSLPRMKKRKFILVGARSNLVWSTAYVCLLVVRYDSSLKKGNPQINLPQICNYSLAILAANRTLKRDALTQPQRGHHEHAAADDNNNFRLQIVVANRCFITSFTMSALSRTVPKLRQVVLNDVFTQAFEQARQKPVQLTHNQQVRFMSLGI